MKSLWMIMSVRSSNVVALFNLFFFILLCPLLRFASEYIFFPFGISLQYQILQLFFGLDVMLAKV